jgi:hypothetical protein
MRIALALAAALILSACALKPPACLTGKPAIQTQLYFGMNSSRGAVSPRAWQGFVAAEIAPRLAEGFTIVDARGFWLGQDRRPEAENSKLLIRIHHGTAEEDAALAAIIRNYKKSFAQESVLRVDAPVCAAF